MLINDLSDEVLLEIFSNLSFLDKIRLSRVCKRWNELTKSYNVFLSQKALGCFPLPAVHEDDPNGCKLTNHCIKPDDCILYSLFDANKRVKGLHSSNDVIELAHRLIADSSILESCLKLCGRTLKVLGINFCYSVNESIIRVIACHCTHIEHLDLSFSSSSSSLPIENTIGTSRIGVKRSEEEAVLLSDDCWLQLSNTLKNTLKHLNVTCFSGVTDEALMIIFENCEKLEDISVSCSIYGNIKGYCLTKTPKNVKKVSLFVHYDDKTTNVNIAVLALQSLAKSEAKQSLRSLRVLQSLRRDTVNEILLNFPQLEYLHIGDNVFWVSDFHFKKVTAVIGLMKNLVYLSLKIPESFRFDIGFSNIVKNCTNLRTLHIFGGRICDDNLIILPAFLPNLESLVLSYSTREEPRITDNAFSSVGQLSRLKELALNGVGITDTGIEQFCSNFIGEMNHFLSFDVRNCAHLTCKTLNTLIECSKKREGTKSQPLTLVIDPLSGWEIPDVVPMTIKIVRECFTNELGLRNEYFAPRIQSTLIGDKFTSFAKYALQDIAEKYLSDFFK